MVEVLSFLLRIAFDMKAYIKKFDTFNLFPGFQGPHALINSWAAPNYYVAFSIPNDEATVKSASLYAFEERHRLVSHYEKRILR